MAGINNWYVNIDKGKYTGLIFIDLKKAFDAVNQDILLKQLEKYGISGLELDWFYFPFARDKAVLQGKFHLF